MSAAKGLSWPEIAAGAVAGGGYSEGMYWHVHRHSRYLEASRYAALEDQETCAGRSVKLEGPAIVSTNPIS